MIPLKVTARNYGPYESLDWDIPAGLSAIVGNNTVGDGANSNGSGKTKLLELVPICLFGPPLPWSEYLTVGAEETVCTVTLAFEHGGEPYRIRRTYDAKGRGKTTLDFEHGLAADEDGWVHEEGGGLIADKSGGSGWQPLTRGDQKDTQALILQTIGLSEATFAHSVFAAQGHPHFADPSLPPRERKAILAEALNLGVWDDLLKLARTDINAAERELEAIAARIGVFEDDLSQKEQVEGEVAELTAQATLAAADIAHCEQAEEAARVKLTALQSAGTARRALETRRDAAKGILAGLDAARHESASAAEVAAKLIVDIAALEPLAAQRDVLLARITVIGTADATRAQAVREREGLYPLQQKSRCAQTKPSASPKRPHRRWSAAGDRLALLRFGDGETCDHCGQALAGDALAKAIATTEEDMRVISLTMINKRKESDELVASAEDMRVAADALTIPDVPDADREDLNRKAAEAHDATVRLAGLHATLANEQAIAAKAQTDDFVLTHRKAVDELEVAEAFLRNAPAHDEDAAMEAGRDLTRANNDVVAARATDRQIRNSLAASEERLRNIVALAERARDALTARTELQGRLDTLTALARSYGRDGIPALILETNAIPQVEQTAQTVLEQLGMPFRVELVTQRENKTGGVKDTLDVVVHEPNGPRRYETYSGGERTRIELALRIALARLIAGRSAAHCGLLALDEPSWLDATGMAQLAEVLRGLTEFRSIVLVSHDERLVEAFDQTVHVVKDETGSRLEEAA